MSKNDPKKVPENEPLKNDEGPSEDYIDYRNLKTGDYELHIYLEETRGLVHPSDSSSTVDPIIKLKVFNQSKTTKYKSNRGTGMIYWGEHIFFDKKISDGPEFQLEKLFVQVYDYNLIGENALIGQFEMDLSSIYFSKNHTLHHKWIVLSNYKSKMEEIKGFLKFSVNIVGPGDKQIELDDEKLEQITDSGLFKNSGKGNMNVSNVLLPPQIQTKGWQMKIQLIKAEHLIKMDWVGSIDCYFVFQFGSAQFITEVIKDNVNPFWGKAIYLPYSEPTINEILLIKLFDWDRASNDEIVGSTSFRKKEIIEGKRKNFFWLNIYGAQPGGNEKTSNIMNSNPDLGTFWKGRVLLSLSSVIEENPKLECVNLTPQIMEQFKKSDQIEWLLNAELFFGLSFPKNDEKYSIQIRWADVELNFDKIKTNHGIWEWYIRKNLVCNFPYLSFDELPDIIIYLCSGDERISYIRYPAKYFQDQAAKSKLFYFKPDRSKSVNLRDDQAGIVKMRISLGVKNAFNDISWSKPITKPNPKMGFLYAYIYHAQELLPADSDGTSDPYFKLNYCGSEIKSDVIDDTLNPIWNQTYQLQVPLMKFEDSPPIILRMYDEDVTSDEFIGSVYINVEEALKDGSLISNKSEKPIPKWFNLKYNKNCKSGKILACFNIFDNKPMNWIPKIISDYEKFYVKIKILGLRGLKSMGIFPVRKAYIKFDLNSLRSKEQRHDLQEKKAIFTQPNNSGSDPNISTIISFELYLPKDTTLWPFLNCIVFDSILKGLIQPVLGSFSINLADIALKTRLRLDRKYKKISDAFFKNQGLGGIQQGPLSIGQKEQTIQKKPQFFDLEIGKSKTDYHVLGEEKSFNKSPDKSVEPQISELIKDVVESNGTLHSDFIVIPAKYAYDQLKRQYIETNIPDSEKYFALGYDPKDKRSTPENIKKHYRYYIDTPLEDSPFIDKFTFDEFEIMRGSRVNSNSVFYDLLGIDQAEKNVGKFKGWIDIMSGSEKAKIEKNKATFIAKAYFENRSASIHEVKGKNKINIDKEFIEKTQVIVRVYIIKAFSLPQMDDDSLSDPYIEVKLGDDRKDNKKDYIKNVVNADYYTMFELRANLPGSSQLEINVWDFDEFVRDDLIGQTTIDLENRFFSKKWRKLSYIPIETRNLYSPLSSINRGRIKLWVELIPIREVALVKQIWDIKPKPQIDYELRVIIWECSEIPSSDIEETSDIYVTGRIGETIQKTDIHYRSQDGIGNFNWRMVYPLKLPMKDSTITFQIFDKDILSIDDFISETTLDFQHLAQEAFENDSAMKLYQNDSIVANSRKAMTDAINNINFDALKNSNEDEQKEKKKTVASNEKVEILLQNAKKEGYSAMKDVGKLIISFELIPLTMAKNNPVGLGRNEPNHSPWLPPPANRFQWSWNPLTLFKSLVGPGARIKIIICLCASICCIFLLALLPSTFGSIIGNILS